MRSLLHSRGSLLPLVRFICGRLWCRRVLPAALPAPFSTTLSPALWVSPTTSPVRLGVSPAAAPTLRGVFNQRFEALFPVLEPWVVQSALLPAVRPVYLWANVVPRGATCCSACPILHHSESSPLGLSMCECGIAGSASAGTACPVCPTLLQSRYCPSLPPPTGLDECLFFISLVSDFLAVGFSVSSGCERRRSVSTYAAILVLSTQNAPLFL